MYTVKDAADITGMSEHTIRYYTDSGLIPGLVRDKNNRRLFDDETLGWLTSVKCLRECGMSIADIRQYQQLCLAGDGTAEERHRILWRQKAAAVAQLEEAKQRIAYIEKKLKTCQSIMGHAPGYVQAKAE